MANSPSPLKRAQVWRRAICDRAVDKKVKPNVVLREMLPLMGLLPPDITREEAEELNPPLCLAQRTIFVLFIPDRRRRIWC